MTVSKPRQAWLKALVAKYADGDLQDFSERVKIDRSTVSLLYNGKRTVTDKYAIRISNRLQVDPPADLKLQTVEQRGEGTTPPDTVAVSGNDLSEMASEMRLMRHLLNAVLDRLPPKP